MAVLAGTGGTVSGINGVRKWRVETNSQAPVLAASDTAGAMNRIEGNTDWSGWYSAYGYTPDHMPGDSFAFGGFLSASTGVSGQAMVDMVRIVCDTQSARPFEHLIRFSSNGALTMAGSGGADSGVSDPMPTVGLGADWPGGTAITDVLRWELIITANNPSYASSSTAGVVQRVAGNIDASFMIHCLPASFGSLPAINAIDLVRLNVTDDPYFWELKWAIITDIKEAEIDIEGSRYASAKIFGRFLSAQQVTGTPTQGHILKPDASTWWPTP